MVSPGNLCPLTLNDAIDLTKQLYHLFAQHRIPVIRMGLQASEELDEGSAVLAGPYHPAFGHLVMSSIFLDNASALLKTAPHGRTATFSVNPHSFSKLQGLRKQNIITLKNRFSLESIHIQTDKTLPTDELRLIDRGCQK